MANRINRLAGISHAVACAATLALASAAAHADDTEVFLARVPSADAARPNVLLIIDNSGSMGAAVETQADWDPALQYQGCYDANAIYFATGTEPPPCGSPALVNKSANRCTAAAAAFSAIGQYRGLALSWNASRERWEPLAIGEPNRLLECEADSGIDGDGPGPQTYAADGPSGPWSASRAQQPAWNAMYTLFDGNWLNWRANPPLVMRTRLQIVQGVVNGLLDNLEGVNVGLMQFNDDEGGAVVQAVQDIGTSREQMRAAVDALEPNSFTPLSETLYEAALYLRGGLVDYGNVGPQPSVAAARLGNDPNGTRYLSPLTDECQKNYIVLLTDGEPTRDQGANGKILDLPGFRSLLGSCDVNDPALPDGGDCLDDLAEYLYRSDASTALDGVQNVVTYTIGFAVDLPLLADTARRGGGQYYLADDTASLTTALTELLVGISESAGLFAAPTIPVGAFSGTTQQRDVYVSLFQPTTTARWPGNLKKYQLADGSLVGQDGQDVINPATGSFRTDARSFWSAQPDGDRVAEGGAASRLPAPAARRVYTDIAGPDLTVAGNRVDPANAGITEALLGVSSENRDALISWIVGADVLDVDGDGNTTEPRRQMSDPLHVRPVTLDYANAGEDADVVVFVSTNDGLLHAVDADTGVELWSYLPGRLLPRQYDLFLDRETARRNYGLDGELRLFSGLIDGRRRDILVFGMGRGGDAVFALDVTARNAPVLLWQISSASSGFASLGQTWSAPVVTRVDIGGTRRPVIVLAGGYDDGQDSRAFRTDSVGNALFIVDLVSGERLWSAGAPDSGHDLVLPPMRFSIPAAPRVLDLSGDGLADRLYVGDMGGQLWRFDLLNGNARSRFGEGGVLASLGGAALRDPPASEVRRFYATPDVVFVNCDRGNFLAINMGSGYRGHPLDIDVEDAFFSVRDANVYQPIASTDYSANPITVDDLLDITTDATAVVPPDAAGWRLRMVQDAGEKILSSAVTLGGATFFTSFSPASNVSACAGGLGVNRAYQVDTCNGRPINNLDGSTEPGPLGVEDRFRELSQTGIAPASVLLLAATGSPQGVTICIGLECFPVPDIGSGTLPRTYWMQETSR